MNQIWYDKPSAKRDEALPLGNGRLGALLGGGTGEESLYLFEESVWSGPYKNRNNRAAAKSFDEVRSLLKVGRVEEAQALAMTSMTGIPCCPSSYHEAGRLCIDYFTDLVRGIKGPSGQKDDPFPSPVNYRRSLDMTSGIATTAFNVQTIAPSNADFAGYQKGSSVSYTREAFIPFSTDVMVYHVSATVPKSIYFRMSFGGIKGMNSVTNLNEEDTLAFTSLQEIPFAVVAHVSISGGTVKGTGGYITVEGADEATIYIDVETAYRNHHYRSRGGNAARLASSYAYECMDKALHKICFASGESYADLKKEHLSSYERAFTPVSLDLTSFNEEEKQNENLPTDVLIEKKSKSGALSELYWNFGRYLLLTQCGGRSTLPPTQNGLWALGSNYGFRGFYSLDLRNSVSYLGACMVNLADCEKSLFDFIKKLQKRGEVTARTMYKCRGWTAHSVSDIWGDSAPEAALDRSLWNLGAAEAAILVWDYYLYTQDRKFLKKNYRLLEDASLFFVDQMVPSLDGRYMILNPSVMMGEGFVLPNGETGFIAEGTAGSERILEKLFESTVKAAEILEKDSNNAVIDNIKVLMTKLRPATVAKDKALAKWPMECTEQVERRNLEPLYGLYPGHSINLYRTPELCEAASLSLDKVLKDSVREGVWQDSLLLAMRSSLHQTKEAEKLLNDVLGHYTSSNLFSSEFGMDGNLGMMTAMTRLIVSSDYIDGRIDIDLLPSLPSSWKDGSLKGVCLKGNLRMDLEWKDGRLTAGKIYTVPGSEFITEVTVHYDGHTYETSLLDGKMDVFNVITNL